VTSSRPSKPRTVVCPVCGLELPANLKTCPQDGVALNAQLPVDPFIGTVVAGRYEILSLVGRGGMSVVYKARNRAVGSIVAVKALKADLVSDEELFARFCQEAKAVQMLIHPNIVTVHEFGVTLTGQPFIVMDYLDGKTLADTLEETGRISVKRMLKIFIQVCDALAHAHSHKIIHRDIKPGNIMLIEQGNETDFVKLFDFGFAKLLPQRGMVAQALTQQGDVLGTPLYMSPEQSRGKELDSRTDVYSVGCVMYESLTGKAPIIGDNVLDTMQKQISEVPATLENARPDLYIPEALGAVLYKTLEKDREERYQSMSDLRRDLEIINNALLGKTIISKGALPGLAKLKRLPAARSFDMHGARLVAVACVVMVCTVVGALAIFNYLDKDQHAGAYKGTMPTFSGEPPLVWAKYRQAGLRAQQDRNYDEAQALLELALKETSKFDNGPATATTYLNLASVYLAQQKLSDAEKAASKAQSILEHAHQANGRSMADVFVALGNVALLREDHKGAVSYLEKALAIQQRELGPMHEDVGTTFNLLGRATAGDQNFSRAESCYKQALAIRQSALGPKSRPLAESLSDYSSLLRRMNRNAEADKAQERADNIRASIKN
jgi:tetratricopeptide (TPR) repeat protein